MSVTETQYKMNDTTTPEAIWLEIRTQLEKKKKQIYDEIVAYPPPIPACDAQFNYLLEERARLTQELSRVLEISGKGATMADNLILLREFIASCADIDEAVKARWQWQTTQLAEQSQ